MKNWYVDAIRSRMTEEDLLLLGEIHEPREVAVPFSDAYCSLCVLPDGEIRCYGKRPLTDVPEGASIPVYLSSRDGGLSWKEHRVKPGCVGASVRSPWSDKYLSLNYTGEEGSPNVVRIGKSPDDDQCDVVDLPGRIIAFHKLFPIPAKKRWLAAGAQDGHTMVYYSDDDGYTWQASPVEKADPFVMTPPHKGMRWENSGVEPTIVELADGRLMMILRTSTDYHYVCYSADYGESWTKPMPTSFHGTLTSPFLLRMNDGRIVFFYNNTTPLPEQDKTAVFPPLNAGEISGLWEDVFTNRDANCVAVSEDECETWQGFRELYLNPLRNRCDFRTYGGNGCGNDKSVHQYEAIELPENRILVHVGQHQAVRRLFIFSLDWLYERGRVENFRYGMGSVSTQVYLKSVSGNFRGFSGHCAWNRTDGAVPVPDPCGDHTEAILLRNVADERLVSGFQGLVWNFPAAHRGSVTVRMRVLGAGLRLSLLDHWMNPIDPTLAEVAQITTVVTADETPGEGWTDMTIRYDMDAGVAALWQNDVCLRTLPVSKKAPNGLCYLHLQTAADSGDALGSLVKRLQADGEAR